MREVDGKEYKSSFIESSAFPGRADKIHEKAYEIANENRKFEIENYWKRANYYWLFQTSIYAGYFYSITTEKSKYLNANPGIIITGITCLGFITALAWYLTNKGSKQWQENWEKHVDKLEDGITGPLYKTVSSKETWSVSRINERVSLISSIAWVLLGIETIYSFFNCCPLAFAIYGLVLFIIYVFLRSGKGLTKHEEIRWFRRGED